MVAGFFHLFNSNVVCSEWFFTWTLCIFFHKCIMHLFIQLFFWKTRAKLQVEYEDSILKTRKTLQRCSISQAWVLLRENYTKVVVLRNRSPQIRSLQDILATLCSFSSYFSFLYSRQFRARRSPRKCPTIFSRSVFLHLLHFWPIVCGLSVLRTSDFLYETFE